MIALDDCKHTARCQSAFGGDICGNYMSNICTTQTRPVIIRAGGKKREARFTAQGQQVEVITLVFGPSSSALVLSANASTRNGLCRNEHSQGMANFSAIRADDASVRRRARIWGWTS